MHPEVLQATIKVIDSSKLPDDKKEAAIELLGQVSIGMTLRDYFAAKALQGLLANPFISEQFARERKPVGEWYETQAINYADAMLKARTA